MKKLLVLLLLSILPSVFAATNSEDSGSDKVHVVTSVIPQKFLVDRIGADKIISSSIVKEGKSPATYQPSPSQVMELAAADVLFTLGVPYENGFIHKIEESAPNLLIVDSSHDIEKRSIEDHDHHDDNPQDLAHHEDEHHEDEHHEDEHHEDEHHEDEHHEDEHHEDEHHEDEHHEDEHHDGDDPHTWLSPILMISHAEVILEELIKLSSENKDFFTANYDQLVSELQEVDAQIEELLHNYHGRTVFVYHPSFGYFTDQYGLIQKSIETGGKEPTPAQLEEIIHAAQEENVTTIIIQPEFSKHSAEKVAQAINGQVVVLNPLEYNYFENLLKLANEIESTFIK